LQRSEFHLLEGEMHELRACLADRERCHAEKAVSLQRGFECYTRFGMTTQAARAKEGIAQI
jgi:hypothetical protein